MADEDDQDSKIFNDSIHGHIKFHPLCVAIIDTPQFQRLRNIKQLGAVYFVFPGACHNRFEHSLGVGHLAGELVRKLRDRQPELEITDEDVLCVEIAGLCHDLGHGPFSHMFDNRFMPQCGKAWKHEEASVKMFNYLRKEKGLMEKFNKYNLRKRDIRFIREQIAGPASKDGNNEWNYRGRNKEKSFLYEIVANERNGIDVDKWDYFARDCHHLGIRNMFDHRRFIEFARVIEVDGSKQICIRDKEVGNIYDMFYSRNTLHRRALQHKNCVIIEYMINEALLKASEYLKFRGKNGRMVKLSETVKDMTAYTLVHDDVYHRIRQSDENELRESRAILEAIERRQLYKYVGQSKPLEHSNIELKKNETEKDIEEAIVNYSGRKLSKNDVIVQFCTYGYGQGKENSMNDVRFYSKDNEPFQLRKSEVRRMTPETSCEIYVRVYSRSRDTTKVRTVRRCFNTFCEKRGFIPPKGADLGGIGLTPVKRRIESAGGDHESDPDEPELEDSESESDCDSVINARGKKRKSD